MQTFATLARASEAQAAAKRAFGVIRDELAMVEAEYERQASSNIQVIDYLGEYLRASGGKRVRPALLLLSNYAVGGDATEPRVVRLATVMEMLHTATLVHDDIIDNADLRRNRSSVNARFGNQTAVLMGDWLYMSAFETTVRERSLEIIDILTRLTRKMTEGELMQLTLIGRIDISEAEYFDILRRKTAYLFSACCEVGAILGMASPRQKEALAAFGMELGIAFQLADDVLDLTAGTEQLGKAAGSDLLEGKLTLPLIRLIQKDRSIAKQLESVMFDGEYRSIRRGDLMQRLADTGVTDSIKAEAKAHVAAARKSLDVLPESRYRSCLEDVLTFVTERSS
jgi:octaprenyl-diphosphate synthase